MGAPPLGLEFPSFSFCLCAPRVRRPGRLVPRHPAPAATYLGDQPLHFTRYSTLPCRGEETALHQLPRDPQLWPAASPPPPRLSLAAPAAAPAPRRRHPRATPTLRIRFFSMLSTAKTCSPTAGSSMAESKHAGAQAAGPAADTAGSRRRPDAVLRADLATRPAPAAATRPSTAWPPPLPAPAGSLLALAQTTEPGPPRHENSCKSRTSAGGASQGPARRRGAGRASDWRSPAYRRPPVWAAGEEEGAGGGWGGGGRGEVQGRDLRAGKVSWGRGIKQGSGSRGDSPAGGRMEAGAVQAPTLGAHSRAPPRQAPGI
eukprot:XP_017453310.1 PREDICTED: translation initiation factor IF-2-like [Rattus norvegicus]